MSRAKVDHANEDHADERVDEDRVDEDHADASRANQGPSDPPKRSIELASGPAFFTDEGPGQDTADSEGFAIVAIHGLPGSARDFRWLAPHLSARARVIRLDLPGFGETPVSTEPDRSPEGRAHYSLEVIRALGLRRPIVIGHSMGGVVATALVDSSPSEFSGLGLLSSPGITPHAMLRRTPFRFLSGLVRLPVLGWATKPLTRASFAAIGFKRYPTHELNGALHCVAATSMERHAERIRRLQGPTMVAYCEDDPLIETEIQRELAAACPRGPRLVFKTGGHNPQKTHAAEIARALLSWPGSSA